MKVKRYRDPGDKIPVAIFILGSHEVGKNFEFLMSRSECKRIGDSLLRIYRDTAIYRRF